MKHIATHRASTLASGRRRHQRLARLLTAALAATTVALPAAAQAAALNLASSPLFLSVPVPPNIFFLIDDSGSMDWTMMTPEYDGAIWLTTPGASSPSTEYNYILPGSDNNYCASCTYGRILPTEDAVKATSNMPADAYGVWRGWFSGYNGMYYNPEVTYKPWPGVDSAGVAFADAVPTAARLDPYNASSPTVDLTQPWSWTSYAVPTTSGSTTDITVSNWLPATYYLWTDSNGNGVVDSTDAHTKVQITPANAPFAHTSGNRTDCANPYSCTYTEEIGNFANWFSYYRRRVLLAKSAVGQVVAPSTARMGYATINNNNSVDTPVSLMNLATNSGNKLTLLNHVYQSRASGGTPLRVALDKTGKYFQCTSGNIFGYSASSPGSSSCPILSQSSGGNCQQNFTVMTTDGFYNDSFSGVGNEDGNADTLYDQPAAYGDAWSNTLADIAMKYYEHDLQPSLPDNVPVTPGVDNNPMQHMVLYTVPMGVTGTLSNGPTDPTVPFAWPNPASGDAQKIDDLRHAAYNARGQFLPASNANALVGSLNSAIANITDRTGTAASVAVNSRSLTTGSNIYQARFQSGVWSGDLRAIPIDVNGNLGPLLWSAATQLNAQDWNTGRTIITRGATGGVPFRWSSLSAAEQTALNTNPATNTIDGLGSARLNYLRGSAIDEGTNNNFRVRGFKLGDIVDSTPIYVGVPLALPDMEAVPHSSFRTTYFNRRPMIYVGGNDGMVHGFDASTGNEMLAYVPSMLFPGLNQLTNPSYLHRYYVDGSPTAGDAFYNGAWHTLLVGGLGGGGKGIYALDVTDPDGLSLGSLAFNEGNAGNIALWEFSNTTDADLGYTYGKPTITKMANGKWAAIFGNGYNNSGSGHAVLYIVFLENAANGHLALGTDYIKIDTLAGSTTTPNGLSEPAVVDINGDFVADYVYAGDLQGNLWKFDLTSNDPKQWKVAYGNGSTPRPLFQAVDASNNAQPITEKPEVGPAVAGQNNVGYMIYFGTGKYLETSDNTPTATPVRSFYGIWDKGSNSTTVPVTRADLAVQTIGTAIVAGQTVRVFTTSNAVLPTPTASVPWRTGNSGSCGGTNPTCLGWLEDFPVTGEMSVSDPVLIGGGMPLVIYTTLTPQSSPCSFGGDSWLMAVSPANGGPASDTVFDVNGDGQFDVNDNTASNQVVAGIDPGIGIMPQPVILRDPAHGRNIGIETGSTGAVQTSNLRSKNSGGRQSWIQLK
jgi:type IV pilus assembly protein PilY1